MTATVLKLIARRLLAAIPILLIVSALLFCILRLLPVDPAAMSLPPNATIAEIEDKRREMGLDKPLPQQYLIWLADALHGDFGRSIALRRDAGSLVAATLPATIQLAACAMVIAAMLGLGGGLLLFRLRGTLFEPVADLASIVLLSIPEFLWGLILLFVFGVMLQCAAVHRARCRRDCRSRTSPDFCCSIRCWSAAPMCSGARCQHLILPAVALGLAFSPTIMRVLRSSLFDVYHEDYIQQARLRGVTERRILLGHAFKNASLPTLDARRRAVRHSVLRHAAGRGDLFLSGHGQSDGRRRA